MATKLNGAAIDRVIRRNLKLFRKPGVLTLRPGYKMTGGWITDKPAIIATVDKKLKGLRPSQRLPVDVENVPVDVREATGLQRLRNADADAYALAVVHTRDEFKEPDWPLERSAKTGRLLPKVVSKPLTSKGTTAAKPSLEYSAPKGVSLTPVTRKMTMTVCVSPDDGYPVLTQFLAQTKKHLSVSMYDFTSGDLLAAVKAAIKRTKPFEMVLDHPPLDDTANQTDAITAAQIIKSDSAAKVVWALTRSDPLAAAWIYPTAYHIKVVVRDSSAFWLSSGNFNVSNEPNFAADDPKRGSLATSDRDWHVVVNDTGLAKLYEAFIKNDFAIASAHQAPGNTAVHAKISAALTKLRKAQSVSTVIQNPPPAAKGFDVPHRVFTNVKMTVQPLLTPDPGRHTSLYVDKVLALIQSAKVSVYMQTQYVHPSANPKDKDFQLLVQALAAAFKNGLDVRLITSQYENTAQWLETLKPFDLDKVLRIQNRVHSKGIIVDSKVVLVSSENWSADGCLRNRDAGLIIYNPGIAQYFQAIFMADWTQRADAKLVDVSVKAGAKIARKAR
jgi:PLD-like domain